MSQQIMPTDEQLDAALQGPPSTMASICFTLKSTNEMSELLPVRDKRRLELAAAWRILNILERDGFLRGPVPGMPGAQGQSLVADLQNG
jgi:hypothetical protein